eukprot:gene27783-4034_t
MALTFRAALSTPVAARRQAVALPSRRTAVRVVAQAQKQQQVVALAALASTAAIALAPAAQAAQEAMMVAEPPLVAVLWPLGYQLEPCPSVLSPPWLLSYGYWVISWNTLGQLSASPKPPYGHREVGAPRSLSGPLPSRPAGRLS